MYTWCPAEINTARTTYTLAIKPDDDSKGSDDLRQQSEALQLIIDEKLLNVGNSFNLYPRDYEKIGIEEPTPRLLQVIEDAYNGMEWKCISRTKAVSIPALAFFSE